MTGLIILSPIFLVIWLLISISNKGTGAFFIQERPGKDEKIFKVVKFTTMTNERGSDGSLLPDSQRITKFGRFIRQTSLDEIPQLINVIKGDMSLIGPRPLLIEYLPLYSDYHSRRHEVKPGITGWAQINGRNLVKLSKKFEYDVWYVDNLSFLLDIKIIFMTFVNVLKRKDIGKGNNEMKDVDDLKFADRMIYTQINIDNKLLLRRPEISDKDELLVLKNNREASKLLGSYTHNYSIKDIVSWIKFHRNAKDEILLIIQDISSKKLIGHVGLYKIDKISKKTEFGILIADNECQGKGYGSLCLNKMIDIAFNKLDLNKITLSYLKDNIPAGKLYTKYGFIIEGVLKNDIYKNGLFYDVVLMAKFKSQYTENR